MPKPYACVIGDVSLVRALGRAGIRVAIATSEPEASMTRSRYCRAVVRTPNVVDYPIGTIDAICEWSAAQSDPPVIFYQGDHDLLALSRARARVSAVARIELPPAVLVEDLVDKVRFATLASRVALPVPETLTLRRDASLEEETRAWASFPCVLKPAYRSHWYGSTLQTYAVGNQKALRIETRRELEELLPLIQNHGTDFILQAAIEGGEERILSYHAYVRRTGEIVTEFTGKKVRTAPRLYGLSTYLEITDNPDVKRLGRDVLERLDFTGVVKMDFKHDERDGRLYLLEINPRFNLWHHPSTVAGAPIPALVYQDCIEPGSARAGGTVRAGVRWLNTREDLRSLGEYRAANEVSLGAWLFQVLTAHVNEDFGLTDPVPNVIELGLVVKRKLERFERFTRRRVLARV